MAEKYGVATRRGKSETGQEGAKQGAGCGGAWPGRGMENPREHGVRIEVTESADSNRQRNEGLSGSPTQG